MCTACTPHAHSGTDQNGLALVAADGAILPLSEAESVALFRAIFAASRLHAWRRGDVLLFDNILFGHARMPGRQPRKLHAIFAAEIDTRTLRRADAPQRRQSPGSQQLMPPIRRS